MMPDLTPLCPHRIQALSRLIRHWKRRLIYFLQDIRHNLFFRSRSEPNVHFLRLIQVSLENVRESHLDFGAII
jgi:hypothetical protein